LLRNCHRRLSYARLIIALDEEHQEEVFRILQSELGCRSKYNRADIQYRIAAFWSDRCVFGHDLVTFWSHSA
jgi:hypothetical protein